MISRNNISTVFILLFFLGCGGNLSTYNGQDFDTLQLFDNAVELMLSNGYHQAIPLLENAITQKNGFSHIHLNLAICYRKIGYYDKAIEYFNSALALNPRLYGAYYNRSIVYSRLGKYEKSKNDLGLLSSSSSPEAKLFFIELTFFFENGYERNSTNPIGILEKIS
jgi:tetratricopeptide (TPR) repeat protein